MFCTQFKQQRLPAWQPLLSPGYVAALLACVAVFFLPIGFGIAALNGSAFDMTVRYDQINRCTTLTNQGAFPYDANGETYNTGCVTSVEFQLPKALNGPVYVYYGLTNFYQNHRRFSNSKSDAQLAGDPVTARAIHNLALLAVPGDLHHATESGISVDGAALRYSDFSYAPAGLVPWSMFNDSFALYSVDASGQRRLICDGAAFSRFTNEPIGPEGRPLRDEEDRPLCHKKGIAWKSDVEHKYKAPHFPTDEVEHKTVVWSAERGNYPAAPALSSNDTYFDKGWYANEPGHAVPATTDEDLMVWARVASMPKFRKLYRVIDADLLAGKYVMRINETYDVSSFGGEKSFTIATLSWLGGRNSFLATLYIVVGVLAGVAALALTALHKTYGTRAEQSVAMLIAE